MNYFLSLKKKIVNRKARICIIGLGYVGMPLIKNFSKKGFKTIGIDKDFKKKDLLKKIKNSFFSSNYKIINEADIIIITLPTPLKKNKKPDLKHLISCSKELKKNIKEGQLISLESTSYPGTTEEIFLNMIIKRGFIPAKNFFLTYSPERISPELKVKNKLIKYNLQNTPKICGGFSDNCFQLGEILYGKIVKKVIKAKDIKSAESAKMLENVYRSVNIAMVNELKMFFNKIKIDIHEVIKLAGTKPFGFTKFLPGPGFGGHCIPLDPFYLYWLGKKNNFHLKFIKSSGEINDRITNWIVKKILNFLKKNKINFSHKKILILGVAYKKDINDLRESPGLKIAAKLKKNGYDFEYSDPYFKKINFGGRVKKNIKIDKKNLKKYPAVLLTTDHTLFNYKLIEKDAKFLFDTRNKFKIRTKNLIKL